MEVRDSVFIVTGSSSGVGAATVRMLAEQGGKVVINYSSSENAARKVADECEELAEGNDSVLVCQANVSDDAACKHLVEATLERWGRVDGLVNNAGTTKFVDHNNLDGLQKDDFFNLYGVNVVGPYQMTRAAEQALRASGDASIVNIASIAGVKGIGSSIAYAASKGALITMTKSLARVMGPEIRVNSICPGFIQGEWLKAGMGAERYAQVLALSEQRAPLGRVCTAESVAESIVYFLKGASIVTGESLILDGGSHLNY
jgi:3-oxoacyl-[acyl-carrier protein] reductase